jgi:putative peptidoglycan lipid II flippase
MRGALRGFFLLAAASLIYKSQPLVERTAGAILGKGIPAALGYADKITSGLTLLAAFGFSVAALPALSRALASGAGDEAVTRLRVALTATIVTTTAVVAFGIISHADLVRLFYERGAFGSGAASTTSELILFALPTVAFGALAGPIVATAYAAGRIRRVATVGLAGFATGAGATALLAFVLGSRGIVLGTACGACFTFIVFSTRMSDVLPLWSWREFLRASGARLAAVLLLVAVAAFGCERVLSFGTPTVGATAFLLAVRFVVLMGVAGGALFVVRPRHSRIAAVKV